VNQAMAPQGRLPGTNPATLPRTPYLDRERHKSDMGTNRQVIARVVAAPTGHLISTFGDPVSLVTCRLDGKRPNRGCAQAGTEASLIATDICT
jgi:hypothetical protein